MNSASNKSRRGERRAVNLTRLFFEDHDLVFQEIDLRNDFGKDAVLDLARSGSDAGLSVALQIKGGRKYKRKAGHSIPVTQRLRNIWANSSLPMFVIVLDPDDGELYWGDLSRMADTAYGEVKTVSVLPNNRLTPDGLDEFLETARLACSARRSDPLLNLTSTNPSLVQSALFDCLAVGRHDARYFKLVRWAIPSMGDQRSVCSAIHLLAHATSHPDIFWHRENTVQERVAAEVRTSFRWTPNELAMLLARVPEEELWERGTFGESLYMIMVADPSLEWSIDRLMTQAFLADELIWLSCWVKGPPFGPKWVRTDRESIIIPLLTLALYVAKDPRDRLDELAEHLPPIRNVHLFSEIAAIIEGFGQIDIF